MEFSAFFHSPSFQSWKCLLLFGFISFFVVFCHPATTLVIADALPLFLS
jgi:hypothetical protein